jgi:hypothetical protein
MVLVMMTRWLDGRRMVDWHCVLQATVSPCFALALSWVSFSYFVRSFFSLRVFMLVGYATREGGREQAMD